MGKKIFIKTFGCQMNVYDSNRIFHSVKKIGFEKTEDQKNADCFLLNTCHIRDKAKEKVYHEIGRVKKIYKKKPKPIVVVAGCVAQAENEEMLKREPYIDIVIGPQSYHKINNVLDNYVSKKQREETEFDTISKFDFFDKIENKSNKVSAFITIQEGCDKFCHFCVVPFTRGPEYSRSFHKILSEVESLIKSGVKEITLLGQNVNAYSYIENSKEYKLSDLINQLEKYSELERIRYTTSHPRDMTEDLIDCYKNNKKLMPLVHLPVQSGSDKILKLMNRKHTVEEYVLTCEKLNKLKPCKFYLAVGKNDKPLIDKIISSPIGKNCISFENLSISEILPIIKNCDFYLGNDTGFLHLSCALGLQCIAIFFNSPVLSYGTYATNITCIIPKGETMKTVIHDLKLGRERISVENVYNKAKELLN